MSQFNQYDPLRVIASFRGIPLNNGVKDGTFISAMRNEDTFSIDVGATGDVTRVRSRNATGRVTVTLMQGSITNDLMSAVAQEDEAFGTGFGPVLIRDLNGNTVCDAPIAWIVKPAEVEFADEAGPREWVIECADFATFIGGNSVI